MSMFLVPASDAREAADGDVQKSKNLEAADVDVRLAPPLAGD